ncbi:TIGR03084 family metal-binding protein [Jatrophihabitans endophyticus]|uniref:TIGR03084 family metal-binding protein n=1 Tax=Jatrophihabitans endophyticus TaxID=1206085 RepID=UPI0019E42205|nr:TIGR03084 family metal-binding protein [Jatrophihabitans endophyticus]MBE7187040.1 TIGR03084 family protein [Jatrophihabitans endophyticus]
MPDLDELLSDLAAESLELDDVVAALDPAAWRRETPARGWTVAHQIAHLGWTDEVATLAAADPDAFAETLTAMSARAASYVDDIAAERAALPPAELVQRWRAGRRALTTALRDVPPGQKLPWFGPPMSPGTMATARLMETWAHGQDVVDAIGVRRPPTARLQHVAHIGVRTRDFAYLLNDRTPPSAPFRVELAGPDGQLWAWGPDDADATAGSVAGPALDFCLLVTQRRHRDDLGLVASGEADAWLDIAQAFAGAPGGGRAPGQFA